MPRAPRGACSGSGMRSVIGVLGSGSTSRSPKVGQRGVSPGSQSNSQTGKFESMPPSTMTCSWFVFGFLGADGLEEDRDRHAHADSVRDLERVPALADRLGVAWQNEQSPGADV